jgi:SAM-dependent methyltransferase/methyltransferase-like protein
MHGVGAWSGTPFRYLELGSGNGANVLALAAQFPRCSFVGVDRDGAAIAEGRRVAEACGIENLELVEADVRGFSAGDVPFDYVLCHGVYSWVPPDAQERILALAQEALAPLGVACVSYNTLPGWGVRGVVRDAMRDAAGGARGLASLRAAKGRLAELRRRIPRPGHPYSRLLGAEIDLALSKADGYLLQEHLSEVNEPLHVKELLRRASAHGLAYVCEMLSATPEGDLDLDLVAELTDAGMARVDAEECLDVLTFRQLRATLLCKSGVPVAPTPAFEPLVQTGFFSAFLAPGAEEPLLGPGKSLVFRTQGGAEIASTEPLLKAALLVLSDAWPAALPAQQLIGAAMGTLRERGLLEAARVDEARIRTTLRDLTLLARRRLIEILPWAPQLHGSIPARPLVRALTRVEAARSPIVTSPSHESMVLDEPTRTVVRLLDGTRDLRALIGELSDRIDSGELTVTPDVRRGPSRAAHLAELLGQIVKRIRRLGLLGADTEAPEPALAEPAPVPAFTGGPG